MLFFFSLQVDILVNELFYVFVQLLKKFLSIYLNMFLVVLDEYIDGFI